MIRRLGAAALLLSALTLVVGGLAACVAAARAHTAPLAPISRPRETPVETRIACTLSVPPTIQSGAPVQLTVSFVNQSSDRLRVLGAGSAVVDITDGNTLEITCDGKELAYSGPIVDWDLTDQPPTAYRALPPGGELRNTINLEKRYRFPASKCTVGLRRGILIGTDEPGQTPKPIPDVHSVRLNCNAAPFEITP